MSWPFPSETHLARFIEQTFYVVDGLEVPAATTRQFLPSHANLRPL